MSIEIKNDIAKAWEETDKTGAPKDFFSNGYLACAEKWVEIRGYFDEILEETEANMFCREKVRRIAKKALGITEQEKHDD